MTQPELLEEEDLWTCPGRGWADQHAEGCLLDDGPLDDFSEPLDLNDSDDWECEP